MTVTYITVFFVHFISADLVKGESVFLWGNVTRFSPKNPFPVILLGKVIFSIEEKNKHFLFYICE